MSVTVRGMATIRVGERGRNRIRAENVNSTTCKATDGKKMRAKPLVALNDTVSNLICPVGIVNECVASIQQ